MLFILPDILSLQQLDEIRSSLGDLTWRDGRKTAGKRAASVKANEQADLSSPTGKRIAQDVLAVIGKHPVVRAAARPKRFSNLLMSRTRAGGGYGYHIDNAIMGVGVERFRADISFTLFLSDPDEYEGGELEIEMPGMIQSLKPEKGSLVLYPSDSIHRVAPVTGGERIVCVGWIQTLVRDLKQREILLDLENLRAELGPKLSGESREMLFLNKTISNLLRMWAEP